jgi:hypothetical protein
VNHPYILTSVLLCLTACNKPAAPLPAPVAPDVQAAHQANAQDARPAAPAVDAASTDAAAKDYQVDNTVAECADVVVHSAAVGPHQWELSISIATRKNIGSCGCVSALLRYRVLRGEGSSLAQLATGTINSFAHTAKSFVARHRVAKAGAPYVVQVACNGG